MDNQTYLQGILENQNLTENQIANLKNLRDTIQSQLSVLSGNPVFYYAGSYAKKTMIKTSYDLDIVMYWPYGSNYTLKGISDAVGDILHEKWQYVNEKTVAWEIPFKGDFHIDVVPGRALDNNNHYANLYRRDNGQPLQTSLKEHINSVKNSDRREIIKLVKLWKKKNNLPFKTFILEQMVISGCKGKTKSEYEPQLIAAFQYIYDNILTARIEDPANTNNVISSDMTQGEKTAVRSAAKSVIDAKYWSNVYG